MKRVTALVTRDYSSMSILNKGEREKERESSYSYSACVSARLPGSATAAHCVNVVTVRWCKAAKLWPSNEQAELSEWRAAFCWRAARDTLDSVVQPGRRDRCVMNAPALLTAICF